MDEGKLRVNLAERLTAYRKLNNFTQLDIAEKLNYSDKSISKWERGDGVPDIFVLSTLAELYGVTVDDLISDRTTPEAAAEQREQPDNKARLLISVLSVGLAFLVAVVVFFAIKLLAPETQRTWLVFICAIPAASIVAIVFSALWGGLPSQFGSISCLIWSLAIAFHLTLRLRNILWIYLVAGAVWILMGIWFILRKQYNKTDSISEE